MTLRRKKFLVTLATFLCLTAFGFLIFLFIRALEPSARADSSLITVKISDLAQGDYLTVNNRRSGPSKEGYSLTLMIYRSSNNQIFAWSIPTKNGLYLMPDISWNRPFYECSDFGPTIVDGRVDESIPIQCHDQTYNQSSWQEIWQWDLSGKNITGQAEDLRLSKGAVNGDFFVY